jgi:hypothetical protein
MKKFLINGKVYTFDTIQNGNEGWEYAKCRENGKCAFLDVYNGVQFEGENRVIAEPCIERKNTFFVPRGFHCWGGELRHSASWRKQWG